MDLIRDFRDQIVKSNEVAALLGTVEYSFDGGAAFDVELIAFEWDFYQKIMFNYITVTFPLETDEGTDLIVKNMIYSLRIFSQMNLEQILNTIQVRVGLFFKYYDDGFDFEVGQRIQQSLSNWRFAKAEVCMAGLTQVNADSDAVFDFINKYETIFDGFLTADDFMKVFGVEIDIDGYYEQFYSLVQLNIFQRCIMSYFNFGNAETELPVSESLELDSVSEQRY